MKSQRKSLIKDIKAHSPLILNEPVGIVQPLCSKLYTKQLNDWKNVDQFLKLRELKCEKNLALLYSSKKNCRIDQPIPQPMNKLNIHSTKSIDVIILMIKSKKIKRGILFNVVK